MKITKIFPLGWCEGVSSAFINLKKIKTIYPDKKIYMIGWLVHNETVMNEISSSGIEVLDIKSKKKLSMLKKIKDKSESVIVFSAHGTDPNIIRYAKENFYGTHDLTCKYVFENMNKVKNEIEHVDYVLFFGTKKHPEAEAFRSLDPKVKILSSTDEIGKLKNKNAKVFATTQSTVPIEKAELFREKVMKIFPNAKYLSGICAATNARQENLQLALKKIDVLVVVGDKKSNNTKSMVLIAQEKNIPVKWFSSWKEIIKNDFKKYKNCGLCSGASTPLSVVNEIYEVLSSL